MEAGADAQWVNEPWKERHADMTAHTEKPYNAEPPNYALCEMITPKGLHYRRQHTPVPVVDEEAYRFQIGIEGKELRKFSLAELKKDYAESDLVVTFMCTGNRRSEYNTPEDGETMGLPWKNGSISTAKWSGCSLKQVLKAIGVGPDIEDEGYGWLTLYGLEDYHISIPIRKALERDNDCTLAWKMNGETLPRDHGFPLRVIIPGYVGARSVKWISKIVVTKNECDGMHQKGIAYKLLAPNIKSLASVAKEYIESMPPADFVPITSAVTKPDPGTPVRPGQMVDLAGYAYAGAGKAVIRIDVSVDGGKTWKQADFQRADETQKQRGCRAWAWIQWQFQAKVPDDASGTWKVVCKAVDDQYNQQPENTSSIWNIRGLFNNSWGQVVCKVNKDSMEISQEARSGDGSVENVGVKMTGEFKCPECRQQFDTEQAKALHWKFIHDPNRHQED